MHGRETLVMSENGQVLEHHVAMGVVEVAVRVISVRSGLLVVALIASRNILPRRGYC